MRSRVLARARTAAAIAYAPLALTIGEAAFERTYTVRGRRVRLNNRGPGAPMGRHGGGWDLEIGLQLGRNRWAGTILLLLGKGSIRIDPR